MTVSEKADSETWDVLDSLLAINTLMDNELSIYREGVVSLSAIQSRRLAELATTYPSEMSMYGSEFNPAVFASRLALLRGVHAKHEIGCMPNPHAR